MGREGEREREIKQVPTQRTIAENGIDVQMHDTLVRCLSFTSSCAEINLLMAFISSEDQDSFFFVLR